MPALPPFRGYIFDLDGTIYLSESLIPGADAALAALRANGARCVFMSNKALQTREDYAAKLNRLGIPAAVEDVVNSSFVMARYLARTAPGATVYVLGERPLAEELERAGLRLGDAPERIDYVVCSMDRGLHYGKINIAFQAVRRGARMVATNPDRTCPFLGYKLPDCAGVIAMMETVTGRKVEIVVGKPNPLMVEACVERLGVPLEQCLFVGDRLDTDIVMGRTAGCRTAVVLTGVTRRDHLAASAVRPDYVLDSVRDLAR